MSRLTKLIVFFATFLTVLLIGGIAFAQAAPVIVDPTDWDKFIAAAIDAIKAKDYVVLLALGVSALVFVTKRFGPQIPKVGASIDGFLKSDPGSILLVFAGSFAGALFFGPKIFVAGTILAAVKAAFYAMGGYSVVIKLLLPLAKWIWSKISPASGAAAAAMVAADATKVGQAAASSDQAAADAANKLLGKK